MKGRVATTAHPMCTCRAHDHNLDTCPGTNVIYRRADGSEYAGGCLIIGGIEWSTRQSCPMHKP